MSTAAAAWADWIGRTERAEDHITAARVHAWYATLDGDLHPAEGEPAPLGFHWTLAPPVVREGELGADGHPRRTDASLLPPVPLPRRLWAGSRISFHHPLRVGERVRRESTVASIVEKRGKASALVFVTVSHRFMNAAGVAIEEEQDLVYREPAAAAPSVAGVQARAVETAPWQRTIRPTETLLFRYSALTFNGHRIHYDRRYAQEVEGYDGLVVHGPLIATLLLELAQANASGASMERFAFRAMRPTFDTSEFTIGGGPISEDGHMMLWSTDNAGERAVEAEAWMR